MQYVLRALPAVLTVLLGAGLIATIYFTLLDWQWVAFLSGILSAALLALASRASQVEWRIARRNVQILRSKESLAQETIARKRAEEQSRASDEKLRFFSDALPTMLVYVDTGLRFRFHNRAYQEWLGLNDTQIDGQLISDVLGTVTYSEIQDKVASALSGQQVNYERTRTMPSGAVYRVQVSYYPHFNRLGQVIGFFGFLNQYTEAAHLAARTSPEAVQIAAEPEPGRRALVVTDAGGQTLYLNSMTEELTGWSDPEARLRRALSGDEFRLFSQKIVAVKDSGSRHPFCEILIRLQEEEDNLAPPGAFIPVAEQFNMTTQLDCWVVRKVISWHSVNCRDTSNWYDSIYCINLFASTISDAYFGEFVCKQLIDSNVPPQVLCFEINESEAVERLPAAVRFVANLRCLGCRIALGGFGGSKVSFDILKHLPAHFLKIDGSIVRDIENDPVSLAKLKAISRVSKVIGVRTIAQFVESGEMLVRLAEFGVDYAQGFGIDRPQPLAKFS